MNNRIRKSFKIQLLRCGRVKFGHSSHGGWFGHGCFRRRNDGHFWKGNGWLNLATWRIAAATRIPIAMEPSIARMGRRLSTTTCFGHTVSQGSGRVRHTTGGDQDRQGIGYYFRKALLHRLSQSIAQ